MSNISKKLGFLASCILVASVLAFSHSYSTAAPNGNSVFHLIKDINSGAAGSLPAAPYTPLFRELNGKVYFRAYDGTYTGEELWQTDHTEIGTVLVKDINLGGSSQILEMVVANDHLFLSATDGDFVHKRELWVSDGTSDGTVMVKDINGWYKTPDQLVVLGDKVLFESCFETPSFGCDVWISDGTADGTHMLADILTERRIEALSVAGSQAFFFAHTAATGTELWVTDGTEAGTHLVEDLKPGENSAILNPYMTVLGDIVLFNAFTDTRNGLVRSDGTEEGTWLIPMPGVDPSTEFLTSEMVAVGGIAIFQSTHPSYGQIPFLTDGTSEGTHLLGIYQPSGFYGTAARLGEYTYFSLAIAGQQELYRFSGPDTAELFLDLRGTESSGPMKLTTLHDHLYFSAWDNSYGRRVLYRTDGTAGNAAVVAENEPASMTVIGDRLYAAVDINGSGLEPWIVEELPRIQYFIPLVYGQ